MANLVTITEDTLEKHQYSEPWIPSLQPDRRRHRRLELQMVGRFMREEGEEFACRTQAMSVGAVEVLTDIAVRPGENIVLYLDDIGRLEGPVFRKKPDGFVLTLRLSDRRRERLAAQLMWQANKEEMKEHDRRRPGHDRIVVGSRTAQLTLTDGRSSVAEVLDVSISGASIEVESRPPVGAAVTLDQLDCLVVRHHETGIAVAFTELQDPQTLRQLFDR